MGHKGRGDDAGDSKRPEDWALLMHQEKPDFPNLVEVS